MELGAMMNIYILWATVRPEMFYDTYNHWKSNCSNIDNIFLKVAVANDNQKQQIDNYNINNCEVFIADNGVKGVCYPSYYLTSNLYVNDNDIIILSSDDFFAPANWDMYLYEQFKDFDGCLFVNDGYQNPQVINYRTSITIPIMTFNCLKLLNKAIYHPSYSHMFGDTELYFNVRDLGLLKDNRINDNTLFEHRHFCVGKREKDSNDDDYVKSWTKDEDNYNKRMKLSVYDRIKI
jgi:hypothetical protein